MLIPKFHIAFCFVFFLLAKQFSYAQSAESDCGGAIQLCQDIPYNQSLQLGIGTQNEINSTNTCCLIAENSSVWFTFTVFKSGDLIFQINPTTPTEDFDYTVFNGDCNNLSTPAVRCNRSLTAGSTGLQAGTASKCAIFNEGNQCAPLAVSVGEKYALVVKTSSALSGFTLDFTGSTASIHDPTIPIITLVDNDDCSPDYARIYFSRNILSRSFIASDFTITPAVNITSVICSNNSVNINFPKITVAGDYTITTNTDIYDLCGNFLPKGATKIFTVKGEAPAVIATMKEATSCNNDGQASVAVSGEILPYTYLWNDPKNQTTATATSLYAGYYNYWVTGANGCTTNGGISVTSKGGVRLCNEAVIDASCSADDGSIELVGCVETTPGVYTSTPGDYTYLWSNGATDNAISNLAPGPYTVIVTATTCTISNTYSIFKTPLTFTITPNNAGCGKKTADGSATVTISTGVEPYTYLWDDPLAQTTLTATGLSAGKYYCVTVTDFLKCSGSKCVYIDSTANPFGTRELVNAKCGAPNGTATVTATGGTPGYTYLWDDPLAQTTAIAEGLLGGKVYNARITDTKDCYYDVEVKMLNGGPVGFNNSTIPVSCKGGSDGSVTLNLSGGTPPFTYLWSNGNATKMIDGLIQGNYTVTVTSTGCPPVDTTITIKEPFAVLSATITAQTHVLCKNGTTGSATVTAAGGTSPYTYSWPTSPTQTTTTATGLSATTYTVTVTDASGCTTTSTVTLTEPVALISTASNEKNISCFGANDGTALVTATGGTGNYTYSWSNSSIQTTATGLSATTYTATVTDVNGCKDSSTVTLTEPTLLSVSTTVTDETCDYSNNGIATANAFGGTSGYTYLWQPGASTAISISGLSSGTYSVTAIDLNGCTANATAVISQPAPLAISFTGQKNVSCFGGNDGAVTASDWLIWIGVDGEEPLHYTYLWAAGGTTTATKTNLSAGTYSVRATDSYGCVKDTSVTITEPDALTATTSITSIYNGENISCKGANDGTALVNATGGTSAYTYSWNNTSAQTTDAASGLGATIYSAIVTDANGCKTTSTVTLTEPVALTSTASVTSNYNGAKISCFGANDGTALATATGGTGAYTYKWLNSTSQTTTATGLSATTYTVIVTDANNCKDTSTVSLTEPTLLSATTSVTDETCDYSNDGTATASANGGTSPYTYLWASGDTTSTVSGLQAGTYSVTAIDLNGCIANAIAVITQPDTLAINDAIHDISCSVRNDGFITTSPSGGTAPYTYLWDNYTYLWANTPTTSSISGLTTGGFVVTITDSKGCRDTSAILVVWDRLPLLDSISTTDATCSYLNNGTAIANPSVGTFDYTYLWQPGNSTSMSISGLQGGTYSVTVTDYLGCDTTATVVISQPKPLAINFIGRINVKCFGGNDGAVSASISGGTPTYSYSWSPGTATTNAISNLTAGTYSLTVIDSKGCIATDSVTIITINPLPIVTVNSASICKGLGSPTLTASGAASYIWSNGEIVASTTISPTRTTSYTVTGTDVKGCSGTTVGTVTVFQIPGAQFSPFPNPAGKFDPVITFTDQSSPDVNYWNWNFGDGDTLSPNTASPVHRYPSVETTYSITLIVHNEGFCFDTIIHQIVIGPEYAFYIPNAFTPDGDGINDEFFGKGVGIVVFELTIFDRWGLWIFYADDINKGWDGKINGATEAAQQDVYIWEVKLTDIFNKTHHFIGTVTIVK